ncbi:acetyl-CoA hydrolase/transferase family protein [Alicyclobacillus sp. SO9]|uniref:acetyl-CoA hydrolase/transferase family protein n=1 Tax=Alicyclobacillus sp. SO9 TaxID=2665646 RepID=UPI0018E87A74|nr:acetyl-CoA hydrolase/transferase family protein [Alicyclobacillus sp. SO9]QQE79089.1 acetyl-CoA hydrolase/transferase family protein [Alicyclobacillus sp. SO9]
MNVYEERIRHEGLRSQVISAGVAQALIQDGMSVGVSGFTRSGDAKAVPRALAHRLETDTDNDMQPLRINLYSGASLAETDTILSQKNMIERRLPYQSDATLRARINRGEVAYVDQHLSHTAEWTRSGILGEFDIAIIEAVAITEEGGIIPTTSVGNSAIFVEQAKKVIVELNLAIPQEFEGIHDIYDPGPRPHRQPIPIVNPSDRIGTTYIPCHPEKIAGIVITNEYDSPSTIVQPDAETQLMANYILEFLENEVKNGRLPQNLAPLQSGVGSVANAVLSGLKDSSFENLEIYTEVMQDAVFELFEAGKVSFASSCSFTLSDHMLQKVVGNIGAYKDKVILRPQEISNHPEVIRRLGIIAINAALEVDIFGNVNSTHVGGTHMMNGLGGSGDFARNAGIGIFVTKSIAKGGQISSVVPFVSHVDHTEHDVDVLVTERGIADLRGLAPRERARAIIEKLAHPMYQDALWDYFDRASENGGNTPHLLDEALSWHQCYAETKDMRAVKTWRRRKQGASKEIQRKEVATASSL